MKTPIFSVRLDPEIVKKLKAIAAKEDRPVGYIVRKAIEEYLKRGNDG